MGNLFNLIQMVQMARNPQQAFMNAVQQNPQMQQMLSQMQNSTGGASFETIVKQMAKQQGISEQQLNQMYNSLIR